MRNLKVTAILTGVLFIISGSCAFAVDDWVKWCEASGRGIYANFNNQGYHYIKGSIIIPDDLSEEEFKELKSQTPKYDGDDADIYADDSTDIDAMKQDDNPFIVTTDDQTTTDNNANLGDTPNTGGEPNVTPLVIASVSNGESDEATDMMCTAAGSCDSPELPFGYARIKGAIVSDLLQESFVARYLSRTEEPSLDYSMDIQTSMGEDLSRFAILEHYRSQVFSEIKAKGKDSSTENESKNNLSTIVTRGKDDSLVYDTKFSINTRIEQLATTQSNTGTTSIMTPLSAGSNPGDSVATTVISAADSSDSDKKDVGVLTAPTAPAIRGGLIQR